MYNIYSLPVSVKGIIFENNSVWLRKNQGVLVISYLCKLQNKSGNFEIQGEAGKAEFKKFPISEVNNLNIPQFYKDAILQACSS